VYTIKPAILHLIAKSFVLRNDGWQQLIQMI